MERMTLKIKVFHDDEMGCCLPEKPVEFLAFWEEKLALIPDEFKETARIEVEGRCSFDYGEVRVVVSYTRPETDDEVATREKKAKDQKDFRENQELCELERLRNKYDV